MKSSLKKPGDFIVAEGHGHPLIWDKAEVLLGKSWGTTSELGEPHGNTFGNKGKNKNNLPPAPLCRTGKN